MYRVHFRTRAEKTALRSLGAVRPLLSAASSDSPIPRTPATASQRNGSGSHDDDTGPTRGNRTRSVSWCRAFGSRALLCVGCGRAPRQCTLSPGEKFLCAVVLGIEIKDVGSAVAYLGPISLHQRLLGFAEEAVDLTLNEFTWHGALFGIVRRRLRASCYVMEPVLTGAGSRYASRTSPNQRTRRTSLRFAHV